MTSARIRISYFIFMVLLLLLFNLGVLQAQQVGEVKIGNKVIFRFQDDGINNPVERAEKVQARIEELMDLSLTPADIKVVKKNGDFNIYWGVDLITSVDLAQARLNNTNQASLARAWAKNFKDALVNMAFYLVPARLNMALHSKVKVRAGGVIKGNIVKEYDSGNVVIEIDQENSEVTITATDPGESKIVFRRGGVKAPLHVRILDNPAKIMENIETEVSGDPAPKEVLQYAAKNACRNSIELKPGAKMEIGDKIRVARTLDAGRKAVAHVPVVISGKGFFTIKKDIQVVVHNAGNGFQGIKTLMVSDRPEAFSEDGILFKDKFTRDNPTRLLFYHQNGGKKVRRFWIQLKNNSDEVVHVMTGGAMGGPSRWGVTVGHMSAMRFLEMYQNAIGYTIQIPPGQSVNLIDLQVQSTHVLCGYFHLNIRKGNELEVNVKNSEELDSSKENDNLPMLKQPFDPFRIHPRGTFKPANLDKEIEYTIDEDEKATCIVGQAPWLIDKVTGEPNNGNYGVFYRFKVKIKNPGDKVRRVGFYFVPMGVLARGSFILDGKIMETGMVRFPSKSIFAIVDVKPGSEKTVKLLTTPEGGSYYPVAIEIRPLDDSESGIIDEKKDSSTKESESKNNSGKQLTKTPVKGVIEKE